VKDDPNLQNLSKADEKELQDELLASREEKRMEARPSNRSAAQDYRRHISQINDDVSKQFPLSFSTNQLYLRSPPSLSAQVLQRYASLQELTLKTCLNPTGFALKMPRTLQRTALAVICGISRDYLRCGHVRKPKVSTTFIYLVSISYHCSSEP
jgi:hypothetical protein